MTSILQVFKYAVTTAVAAAALLLPGWSASTPLEVSQPRATVPPNVVITSNRPMVMLAVSKDHSLFGPVYTDFEDLDEDGVIDTTFKPSFKYYGYFDATKCYSYAVSGQFEPAALATVVTGTTNGATTVTYKCASTGSYWSGNFLNWATMTRLDTVRKMLYGGNRSTDASGNTVLQGSELVQDAHSFVKYYRGDDIRDYTPFTTAALTKTIGPNSGKYAGLSICTTGSTDTATTTQPVMRLVKGNVRFWSTVEIQLCRWRDAPDFYNSTGTFGPKLAYYYQQETKDATYPQGIAHEVTIPSRTDDGATYSNGAIGPELNVNVKVCVATMLGEERCQPFPYNSTTNYKPYGLLQEFGYPTASGTAARAEFGLITGSYDANDNAGAVRKFMGDLTDEINPTTGVFCHLATCPAITGRTIGNGAIKALDAILLYGRTPKTYNASGTPSSASARANLPAWGNPIGEMLVQSLLFYASTTNTNPSSSSKDSGVGMPITPASSRTLFTDPLSNDDTARTNLYGNSICRPLHVLALSPSALSFDGQAGTPFANLPNTTGTLDSYTDRIGVAEGIAGTVRSVGSVTSKGLTSADDSNSCSAKTVGSLSNVNGICPEAPAMGGTYQVAGAALYGNTARIRNISSLPSDIGTVANALKVKTLAASLTGGTPRIDVLVPGTGSGTANPAKYVYITPESVQNGGAVSAPLTFASIAAGANTEGGTFGSFIVTWNDILLGGDYDMDITGFIRYDTVRNGSNWDIRITTDIPGVCGGGAGTHGFSVIGVRDSSGNSADGRYLTHQHYSSNTLSGMPPTSQYLCGDSSYRNRTLGAIAPSLADTTYYNSRNGNAVSDLPANSTYANTVCNVTGGGATYDPTIRSLANYCTVKPYAFPVKTLFRMAGETNALIKDPLWYAAKYGYFTSSVRKDDGTYANIDMPTTQASWDSLKADGTSGSDGIPDGYFLARRPEVLEAQLRRALADIAGKANSAPTTSTLQLVSDAFRYDVTFNADTYAGNIAGFQINASGDFASSPKWNASTELGCRTRGSCAGVVPDGGNSRQIITNQGNGSSAGVKFRWADLPVAYQTLMTTSSRNVLSTDNAMATVSYVRGDATNESAATLRDRGIDGVLGAIVNSTPWIENPPAASYSGTEFAGYAAFAKANRSRAKLLWAGANDGMLHAFAHDTGKEVFAYVPGVLANRLAEIPLQRSGAVTRLKGNNFVTGNESRPEGTLWPYVDGSPFTADVRTGADTPTPADGAWRTFLFGSLGRGGRAVFALDATSASTLAAGEGSAASIFRWQFTADDDADLGYIPNDFSTSARSGQASPVVKLNNGKFAFAIGNGYKSANEKAVLYLLQVDGPGTDGVWGLNTDYFKLTTNNETSNGLSQVTWVDLDGNGTADAIYAGDLQGNLWKFDVSSKDSTKWDVAYKNLTVNAPLFTAQSDALVRLPITTAPQYVYGPFNGPAIFFGTGSAFEAANYPTTVRQRIYTVLDRPSYAVANAAAPSSALTSMVSRTLARDSSGNVTISGTADEVDWTLKNGWYATFQGTSEVMVADASINSGTFVFTTIRPPAVGSYCTTQPASTLFALDTLSGVAKRSVLGYNSALSSNNIGVTIQDQKVKVVNDRTGKAFTTSGGSGGSSPPVPSTCADGQSARRIVGATTNKSICFNSNPRKQWREIPGLRTTEK